MAALALGMLDTRLPLRPAPASNGRAAPCLVPDKVSGLVGFPTRPRAPAKVPGIKKITLLNRHLGNMSGGGTAVAMDSLHRRCFAERVTTTEEL